MYYIGAMKKYYFIILFLLLTLAGFFIYYFLFRCNKLQCITTRHLSLTSVNSVYESTRKTYHALYNTPYGLFRIEKQSGLSKKDADNLTTVSVMTAQGLFNNARSPYPGPLSDEITCDKKYAPTPETYQTASATMTLFNGYTNNRLQYGTCIDDQVVYKGYTALFYCRNYRTWYKAEILIPMKDGINDNVYISLLQAIQCE